MERELTTTKARGGFALVAVLIIAAIGLLFGAGSLLLFRFQCQKRIDRQHEIEKYFAVRSALQLLSEDALSRFPDELSGPKWFVYQADSGRNARVIVNPAKALFPKLGYRFPDGRGHFYVNFQTISIENEFGIPGFETKSKKSINNISPNSSRYAWCVNELMQDKELMNEGNYLSIMHGKECASSNGIPRCWLKMDMSPTGRWSDDLFGRRYMFNLHECCKLTPGDDDGAIITNDTYRLVLKRLRKDEECPYSIGSGDWRPLSGEAVIYAELKSWQTYTNGSYQTEASFAAYTQVGGGAPLIVKDDAGNPLMKKADILLSTNNAANVKSEETRNGYGIQLVGRRLSLYQASTPAATGPLRFDLWSNGNIPEDVYCHFTNDYSTVFSTNMVMVFEVEASLSRNGSNYVYKVTDKASATANGNKSNSNEYNEYNRVANFEVYPAYEYSIDLDYPYGYTNSATVVHLDHVGLIRDNSRRAAVTYDAHGTLNKGWRADERDWREYREWLQGRPHTEAAQLQWQAERGKFR